MIMKHSTKKYLRDCKNLFPIYGERERKFMNRLAESLIDYENQESDITYEQIVQRYGLPTNVIVAYYEEEGNEYLIKKINVISLLKKCLLVIIIFLLIFLCYRSYILQLEYNEIKNANNGYFEEEIIQ